MNFFKRIAGVFKRKVMGADLVQRITTRLLADPNSVQDQIGASYANIVYRCVNAIVEKVATIEINVLTKSVGDEEGYQIDEEHPLIQLLQRPNALQSKYELFYWTALQLNLTGNAYWWLPGDVIAEPTEIIPLNASRMQVDTNKEMPEYIYTAQNAGQRRFSYFEIIHFKKLDPANQHMGKSPVAAISRLLESEQRALDHTLSVFDNRAALSGIVSISGNMKPQTRQSLEEQWEKHKGTGNAGGTLFIDQDANFTPTSATNSQLELLNLRTFDVKEIMAHFRVSPAIVGVQESSNRATAEANLFTFQTQVIKPQMQLITDTIAHKILDRYNGPQSVKLDFVDPVIPDKEYKLRELTAGIDKWITPNEAREISGLKPFERGGDELLRPINLIPVEDVATLPPSFEAETSQE